VVDGTSADKVTLAAGDGVWSAAGVANNGTNNYIVYQNVTTHSQVLIKSDIGVTNNDVGAFTGGVVISNGVTLTLGNAYTYNGKTYYSIQGSTGGDNFTTQYVSHITLDKAFNNGADTTDTTVTAGVDDARTFLFEGRTYVLPTLAELQALPSAIPSGWFNGYLWTSTLSSADAHTSIFLTNKTTNNYVDGTATGGVIQVLPVVLDLNRDGILSYGQVAMDVNGDGLLDTTKWAGAQDGVLVWDKYMDGLVHDNSQYAFAQYATASAANGKTATDLSGLADAFDTNHDGVFNAADAKFAEFKVWQDANQNGISDAGEVRGLLDWGITSINLSSDNIVRTPTAGVTEAGRTTATATDGTQVLVSDAAFEFHTVAPVVATTLTLKDLLQTEGAAAPVASNSAVYSAGSSPLVDQLLIDQQALLTSTHAL
jgi:hypothetical protein